MPRIFLFSALSAFLFLSGEVHSMDGYFVAIDNTEKEYTVYVGIPEEHIAKLKSTWEQEGKPEILKFEDFEKDKNKYIGNRIVKNDYEPSQVADGLVGLIIKFPLAPIGLTWNGGIAITANDYEHARQTYKEYVANPAGYEKTRNNDPKNDPNNPMNHMKILKGEHK